MPHSNMQIKVRRCEGNKNCWAAFCGPDEFLMETSYSLDRLIENLTERHGAQTISLEANTPS
jgi:hypothetical protein